MAFACPVLQTQSRSDSGIQRLRRRAHHSKDTGLLAASAARLRAIGYADVRYGILPSHSRLRGNDDGMA